MEKIEKILKRIWFENQVVKGSLSVFFALAMLLTFTPIAQAESTNISGIISENTT